MELAAAFSGEWRGRELVNENTKSPRITFDAVYEAPLENGEDLTYHLDVEFGDANTKACLLYSEYLKATEEYGGGVRTHSMTSVKSRLHLDDRQKAPFHDLAEQMGPANLYRFDPKSMATPAALQPERKFRLDADGFGLPTLLGDILEFEAERFIQLRREFCAYFPQFRSVRIETEEAQSRNLNSAGMLTSAARSVGKGIYFETAQGTTIRAQQVSDGAILFLGLLALIHSPQPPKLLLIEEPEKGVYPKRLEQIITLIRRLEEERPSGTVPQIVMTTHSPLLLSAFQPEEVTFMSRIGGDGPVRARALNDAPHIKERLGENEFYLGELWYNLTEEELFCDV